MDGHDLTCTLTREELKEFCMAHLDKLIGPSIMDNMNGAKEHLKNVEEVVVTGGMSQLHVFREVVTEIFKKQPLTFV